MAMSHCYWSPVLPVYSIHTYMYTKTPFPFGTGILAPTAPMITAVPICDRQPAHRKPPMGSDGETAAKTREGHSSLRMSFSQRKRLRLPLQNEADGDRISRRQATADTYITQHVHGSPGESSACIHEATWLWPCAMASLKHCALSQGQPSCLAHWRTAK